MKLRATVAVAVLWATGLTSAAAYADTVTLTLTNPNVTVPTSGGNLVPGSVAYEATVSAPVSNSAAVFLNGDSFNVTAPITLDDSDFFSDFPLSLAPGASFTGDLFVLTIPPNTAAGTYLGSFTLLGGSDSSATDSLDTVNFSVANTPEPSSLVLMLTGVAGLLLWAGRKGTIREWAR